MIIIATTRSAIRVIDRATTNWFGAGKLVGSSLLGIVAPAERLAALEFIERLVADPGVPMTVQLQLAQRDGRERAHMALGACLDDALVIQFSPRSHAAERLDESLLWISTDVPGIDQAMRPHVVGMVARAVWRAVPDADVVHDNAIVSVSLPNGSAIHEMESARRQITVCSTFTAGLGERCVTVVSDVRGVHFGDAVMTALAPVVPIAP